MTDETLSEAREALKPFAQLATWIAENRPAHFHRYNEVQIEGWPYTLSINDLIRARRLFDRLSA